MPTRLKRIAPVQCGLVYGILNAFMGFIIALFWLPFAALMASGAASEGNPALARTLSAGIGIAGLIVYPIVFFVFSFIGGVIAAAIYNLVATWTGGIEVTLEQR